MKRWENENLIPMKLEREASRDMKCKRHEITTQQTSSSLTHADRRMLSNTRTKSKIEGNVMRTLQNFKCIQRPEIQYTLIKSKHSKWKEKHFAMRWPIDNYAAAMNEFNGVVYFHFYQCMTIYGAIKINSRNWIHNYKTKRSKPNPLCVSFRSFETLSLLCSIFDKNVPNVWSPFVVIVLQWKCSFAENHNNSLSFLVNTLEQRAAAEEKQLQS